MIFDASLEMFSLKKPQNMGKQPYVSIYIIIFMVNIYELRLEKTRSLDFSRRFTALVVFEFNFYRCCCFPHSFNFLKHKTISYYNYYKEMPLFWFNSWWWPAWMALSSATWKCSAPGPVWQFVSASLSLSTGSSTHRIITAWPAVLTSRVISWAADHNKATPPELPLRMHFLFNSS